jgi:chromosomal replication initiator protein DnaA
MHELNPRFTFDAFVVGAANRLAVTAARTVAESPGTAYNPLIIYGETGLGKTHLLTAIGHLARQLVEGVEVEYVTLAEFVELYQAAVAAGQTEALRGRLGRADVLLVDDAQFLTHRREMQAEVLRIVEALQGANRQIVLTSDRPPGEIQELDDRLLTRFDGGLVVDIDAPDYETRLAILKRRASERAVPVEAAVLEVVAAVRLRNVRELLGLFNRVVAYQAVSEVPLTADAVRQLLSAEAPPVRVTAASEPAPQARSVDEFADFLSGVSVTVQAQVAVWRTRVTDTIRHWAGEGYRTERLEQLLRQDVPSGVDRAIREFERDVDRLRGFQRAMARVDPHRMSDPVFYDPDRLAEADDLVQATLREGRPPPGPSPAWTMEQLITGESNRIAITAAAAIVAEPGEAYNPVVVVGPPGVGKTHVLHAIGNALAMMPGAKVACLSAQEFVNELLDAIDGDRVEAWRRRYRDATALLLDDVHLLAGKERSQEELFHLYNVLLDQRRQLVFTLVAPPGEVEGLDGRVVSRLEAGLLAELGSPDHEIRRVLATNRLKARYPDVEPELLRYLAEREFESVRALINSIQRLLRAAESEGAVPTVAFARALLEGTSPLARPSRAARTSGTMALSSAAAVRSREKVVWEWPEPEQRVIEELS